MTLECFAVDFDHRLNCYVVSARASYAWYLEATKGSEENLKIQRAIITGRKTYETLREDLRRGCVLPPVVLSMQEIGLTGDLKKAPSTEYLEGFQKELKSITPKISKHPGDKVQIIDGLQRTNAIRSVADELEGDEREAFLRRPIRFEVWLNIPFYALAYRMLLLNAGQKPMSMKHQIEILADSMRAEFQDIEGLELIRGIDKRRRTKPGQFQLSTLAGAFQAWIQRQPNVDLRNAVTEQLLAEEAVETLGRGLSPSKHEQGDSFRQFVSWLVELDNGLGANNAKFLGNETVVHALAAAIASSFAKSELRSRCEEAMRRLLEEIDEHGVEEAFSPQMFSDLRTQIDPKKRNVGEATRDLVYRTMSEYVISGGTKTMPECWTFASTYL